MKSQLKLQARVIPMAEPDPTGSLDEIALFKPNGDPFDLGAGGISQEDLSLALATKADLTSGLVPTSQIPAIATGQTTTVASEAAMLAQTATQVQPGDITIRSDLAGRRFILASSDPSILVNWIALETPDVVSSVNSQVGTVVLAKADLGLANVDNTSDSNKPVSTAQAAADALLIPLTQKGAPNGVASLGATSRVPIEQLASGTPTGSLFIRDDGVLAIPAGGASVVPQDDVQNGVVNAADAVVTSLAVSAGGVITGTMAAGICWVKDAATNVLTRCGVPAGNFSLTPASLPVSGAFAILGVDISLPTAAGTPVLAVSLKGTDQTTQALALSNSPVTAIGRVRLLDVVITNTAGTYSLSISRDRRPWARGAVIFMGTPTDIAGNSTATHTAWGAPFTQRMELSGVPFLIEAFCVIQHSVTSSPFNNSHIYDGAEAGAAFAALTPSAGNTPIAYSYRHVRPAPVAGSHLIALSYYIPSGTSIMKGSNGGYTNTVTFREDVRQSASNGTS